MVTDGIRNPHNSVRSHHSTSNYPIHFAYFINPNSDRFRLRMMRVSSYQARKLEAQKHFITTFAEYVYAVIDGASDLSDRAHSRRYNDLSCIAVDP